jgi:ribose/xylose/arabinose/galactoside ABC-type transport system permease subunit
VTTDSAELVAARAPVAWPGRRRALAAVALVLLAVVVYGAATTQGFATVDNAKAILGSVGIIGIVAVGMSFITLSGHLFSITLGTTVVVCTMAFLALLTLGPVGAILATIALGAVIGATQGLMVGGVGANPIVVTIAFGTLQLGIAQRASDGSTVYPPAGADYDFLAATVLGIPASVYVLVVLVAVLELWIRRSRLGHEMYLVGENRKAARAAGLRVVRVATVAFALAGACAGVAGILLGAAQDNATLLTAETYTSDAIAAVLIGGMAVTGGRGAIYRTAVGALFIAVVSDMLLLRGYSTGVQVLVRGVIVVLVIVGLGLWRREATR